VGFEDKFLLTNNDHYIALRRVGVVSNRDFRDMSSSHRNHESLILSPIKRAAGCGNLWNYRSLSRKLCWRFEGALAGLGPAQLGHLCRAAPLNGN
jgi:hypothetical protein